MSPTLTSFVLFLGVAITRSFVYDAEHTHHPWYNQTMHLRAGPFVDDWVPMNLSEALDYFTMYEVCKISGHSTCDSPIPPAKVVPVFKPLLPGGDEDSCGIHEKPNIHIGAMCGNLQGNLLHHVRHRPWPFTRGFLDLMAMMIARGDDTLLLIGE